MSHCIPLGYKSKEKVNKSEHFKAGLYSVHVTLTSTFLSYLKFLIKTPKRHIICMFRLPSIPTTEHSDQNQRAKKRICLSSTSRSPSTIEGNPGRTSCRSRGVNHGGKLLTALLFLCTTQHHLPRGCTTHGGLPPSHQSLTKKMFHRCAHSPIC